MSRGFIYAILLFGGMLAMIYYGAGRADQTLCLTANFCVSSFENRLLFTVLRFATYCLLVLGAGLAIRGASMFLSRRSRRDDGPSGSGEDEQGKD